MNNSYFLTQNGKWITVSNDELYHWKYIKREKKNGEWVYTYPNDKLGVKNFIDTKVTGKAYKQHAQEAIKKQINVGNKKFNADQNKIHAEQTAYIERGNPSWNDPEVRKYDAEYKRLQKDYDALDKEIDEANANYSNKSLKGAVESNLNNVKRNAKDLADKLGVDERAEYRKTKKEYDVSKSYVDMAKATGDKHGLQYYRAYLDSHGDAEKYFVAKKEYMKTPLGKVAKATAAGKDFVNNLFTRKKKTK